MPPTFAYESTANRLGTVELSRFKEAYYEACERSLQSHQQIHLKLKEKKTISIIKKIRSYQYFF
jgi:hypothetical protein